MQALHAHTKYTAGVQLCMGIGFHPDSQIGAVYTHAEAIQALQRGQGAVLLRTLPRGGTPFVHPCVYVLAQGARRKTVDFFPKVYSTYQVIFTHLDLFLREYCPFSSKWNCLWHLKASFAIKGLICAIPSLGNTHAICRWIPQHCQPWLLYFLCFWGNSSNQVEVKSLLFHQHSRLNSSPFLVLLLLLLLHNSYM